MYKKKRKKQKQKRFHKLCNRARDDTKSIIEIKQISVCTMLVLYEKCVLIHREQRDPLNAIFLYNILFLFFIIELLTRWGQFQLDINFE